MPASTLSTTKKPLVAALLSLVIPGAGQLYAGARNAAIAIFTTTVVSAFLIAFTLDNFRVGRVDIGDTRTSWLWLVFAAFWLWNIWDAYQRVRGGNTLRNLGFALPILLVYIIAWQVTDVNLTRLVTRFDDVKIIAYAETSTYPFIDGNVMIAIYALDDGHIIKITTPYGKLRYELLETVMNMTQQLFVYSIHENMRESILL